MKNIFLKQIIIGFIFFFLIGLLNTKTIFATTASCRVGTGYGGSAIYQTVTCKNTGTFSNPSPCFTDNTWNGFQCSNCVTACLKQVTCLACGGMSVGQTCNKGSGNSECGTGYCGSQRSECCDNSNSVWGKYEVKCNNVSDAYGFACEAKWATAGQTCSNMDKWVDHTWDDGDSPDNFLYSSDCECNKGGVYKYCCDAAGNPEYPTNGANVDGKGDWEADCPYGVETGLYGVNGNRIRSSSCPGGGPTPPPGSTPTPPPGCTPTNGTNGSCGAAAGTMHWTDGTAPTTDNLITQNPLCADGSPSTVTTNPAGTGPDAYTYTWTCGGGTGTCNGANGGTASCKAYWLNCNDLNYWKMYDDVYKAAMRPWWHYDNYGRNEGRIWQDPYCDGSTLYKCGSTTGKNCGDASTTCTGTTYTSLTGCGSCTGTKPANCSATSANYCTYQTFTSTNGCGTCPGTKTSVVGTSGSCGGSNSGSFTVASPPTALCNNGTASGVSFSGTTYSWTCAGTAGICAASGTNAPCAATRDLPPTFSSIVVKNNVGTAVAAEGGNVNQICQNEFNEVRTVNLTVNATDPNGAGTISDIQLRWNGINFTRTGLVNGVATFNHTFADGENTTGATDFQVYISDGANATGWITTGRSLKVWNCNVSVSGRLYNGGADGSCTVIEDYITLAEDTNFTSLEYLSTVDMNRISENEYDGNLTWGKNYKANFNTDLAMQISGGGVKTTDVSANATSCPGIAFTLNNSILNPYSTSPILRLRVDFSGVVDQDSWYQTLGGGIMANSRITNRVPVTCPNTTANCAMSINNGTNINGIVASQLIENSGGNSVDSVNKGNPPNNWWVNKPLVSNLKSDYKYFLNQYFWKGGIGTTLNGNKSSNDLGANPTGIYYINGDLLLTANNTVSVGSFLMVVVNGDITIDQGVTNIGGIFVSRDFNVKGSNATVLTINGMIKTTRTVNVNRTFVDKRMNNTAPAVKFVYRPDFVFNMPATITKQLTKWQWGN